MPEDFDKRKIAGFFSVFAITLGVYLYTIAPTVSFWDCGEFIACSHILGVPHPPGTPFYILLGRIFDILLPFKEVAKRINFLSALSTAIAGGLLYLLILKVFNRFKENRGKRLPLSSHLIAGFSALGAGFAYSVWDTSVEAEVYATSILVLAIGLWLTLHWDDNRGLKGDGNHLLLLVYLVFLSFGIHLMPLLLIPGVLVFILMTDWKILKNPKFISIAVLLVVLGVSTYLYLMIRARANPAINEVNPTTWAKLMDVISRKQYGPMKMLPRKTQIQTHMGVIPAFFEQIKIFFKYFSWQFFPYPRESVNTLLRLSSVIGTYAYVLIGIWGMFVHFRRDRKSFWLFFILYVLLSLGLIIYLNLKFSPSDPNPAHQDREVRERDYFWSAAFFFFMFYVGIGLYWIKEWIEKKNLKFAWSGVVLAGLVGFLPLVSNIKSHVNRRGNYIAHDYAHNLLVSPDEYSILFTNGDNDTFPVWFLQQVKGFRKFDPENKKGVKIACFSLMNTNWYLKELKWAGVPIDFDSPFRGTRYEYSYRREKRTGKTDKDFEEWMIGHLYPMRNRHNRIIYLKEMAVRNIIVSSLGKRPTLNDLLMPIDSFVDKHITDDFNPDLNIYFAATVSASNKRGFNKHLVMEGFSYKLVAKEAKNLVNKEKSWDLLMNRFKFRSIGNASIYINPATERLLGNYTSLFFLLGRAYRLDVIPANILVNTELLDEVELNSEDSLKIERARKLYIKALDFTSEEDFLLRIGMELRGTSILMGKHEEYINLLDSLIEEYDMTFMHLFKADVISNLISEIKLPSVKKYIEEAENEYYYVINKKEKAIASAYLGLLKLYLDTDESNKLENTVKELMNEREIYRAILSYSLEHDTTLAIYLLKKWKEVNPHDKKVDSILGSITGSN